MAESCIAIGYAFMHSVYADKSVSYSWRTRTVGGAGPYRCALLRNAGGGVPYMGAVLRNAGDAGPHKRRL